MERWVRGNLAHLEEHGYGPFTVTRRADGVVVGDVCLEHMEIEGRPELELGYDFRSDCWGRGLATEAASRVRDHAFEDLGVTRLISIVRAGNAASARVAGKLGMTHETDFVKWDVEYRVYAIER
jgi:RimJ/RimL family protein N-acetyltransferase